MHHELSAVGGSRDVAAVGPSDFSRAIQTGICGEDGCGVHEELHAVGDAIVVLVEVGGLPPCIVSGQSNSSASLRKGFSSHPCPNEKTNLIPDLQSSIHDLRGMADREGLPALRSGQAKMARGARLM